MFHQSTWKSPKWDLDGILLSKVENVWAWNLQGSYVSWQWRMMQKSKRSWLVSSKLTWGIWRILTWTLENLKKLHFNGLLLTKVYNVWAKEIYRRVMFDGIKYWCKIWRKADLCVQKWHEEFCKFSPEHVSKSKNWSPFLQSRKCMSLKFTEEFVSWQLAMMKNLKRNWLVSSKLTWRIWGTVTWALENLKNLHFDELLLTKVHNVWAKKSIEKLCLMALINDAKFEGKLTCAF